jgi:hypothetical protein
MLLQYPPFLNYYLLFFILLFILSLTITMLLRYLPKLAEEGMTGHFASWWRWIITHDPHVRTMQTYAPRYITDQQVESWLCPICGSKLSKQNVRQLETGYDTECVYCGAIISSSNWRY